MMDERRVGIITLYGLYNHGNRLQNLAIQKMLEDRGFTCESIVCRKSRIKEFARIGIHYFKSKFGKQESVRYMNFYRFVRKYMHMRFLYTKSGLIPSSASKEYCYFIVGSDQVWNPEIRKKERDNFFLRFAKRDQRICLSPSIAVSEIEPQYRREYIQGLNGFRYLSSREEAGAGIIKELVDRTAEVLIDPTMALTKDEWHTYYTPIKIPEKNYVLQLFLEPISKERKSKIQAMADQLGAVVLDIADPKSAREYYSVAPDGFLQLIENAALVCTDSFHAVAFSINFNTPFYVFPRVAVLESSNKMYSRIATILRKFALEDRTEEHYDKNGMTVCEFVHSNEILNTERIKFYSYLDRCLGQKQQSNIMNLDEKQCTGCGACYVSCPTACIEMKFDAEGFYAPVVEAEKCIHCGKCVKNCPVLSTPQNDLHQVTAVAAHSKDPFVVQNSSSGGIFFHLASDIIDAGGVVFGAAFDEEQLVRHIRIDHKQDIIRLQGSKYVQSDIGRTYSLVEEDLKKNRPVLFVGTPCQVAALKKYLATDYENLYTCDFVCHGVPSPEVWKKYLAENVKGDISCIHMRDKSNGWNNYSTRIELKNGEQWIKDRKTSAYNKAFECNLNIRWSCFACEFKGVNRISDITLADFWGIERFYPELLHKEGTSLLLIQTMKGKHLLDAIRDNISTSVIDLNEYAGRANTAMLFSPVMNPYRKELLRHLDEPISDWFDQTADTCRQKNNRFINKVKRKVKRMICVSK